jgi:hypothetical protein
MDQDDKRGRKTTGGELQKEGRHTEEKAGWVVKTIFLSFVLNVPVRSLGQYEMRGVKNERRPREI